MTPGVALGAVIRFAGFCQMGQSAVESRAFRFYKLLEILVHRSGGRSRMTSIEVPTVIRLVITIVNGLIYNRTSLGS